MKRYLCSIIVAILAFQGFSKTTFETANDLYRADNYKEAVETYLSVVKSGFVSSELYYNLGNSYFRLGDYPNAILYYEKAKRLSPKDPDIQMNLGIANTKIKDKFETLPDIFFLRWWKSFSGFFSRDQWAIIFLCFVFVSVMSLAWYFYATRYDRKRLAFYLCFFLTCCSVTAVCAAIQQHREQTRKAGIIMQTKVDVNSSPDVGKLKFTIHGGTKVEILDEIGDYYRIRTADGSNGWMLKDDVSFI